MLAFLARLGSRSYFVAGLVTSLVMFGRGCANEVVCVAGECDEPDTCGDAEPSTCPDPLLAYDPGVENIGDLVPSKNDVGDIVASRLPAFNAYTVCETVVVALQFNGPCNDVGEQLEIAVAGMRGELPELLATEPVAIDFNDSVPTATVGVHTLKIPFRSAHACGIAPLVALRIHSAAACVAVAPISCGENSYRHNDGDGWEPLGLHAYLGLADCHHTSS